MRHGRDRTYYVAAENVDWNYAPLGRDPIFDRALPEPWGLRVVYPKLQYIEYTDATFATRVVAPAWRGILGPRLRASVGDTLEVVFFNRTHHPLSMHPHGVKYDAASEGAQYEPSGAARGIVAGGERYTYTWVVDENAGPLATEPSSKVWLYHSHVEHDHEIYAGLIGTLVITDPDRARADASPSDVDQELEALFMVFNENSPDTPEEDQEGNLKHAINGRIFGNLEGYELIQGSRVRWYVIALGTEVDLHTPHWHGETITTENGSHSDILELLPASMRVADMRPDNPGSWLYHCHVADHMTAGMYATVSIR
jgi:FtsP/CotA-like multicopper oxidase with cupredoxin domain